MMVARKPKPTETKPSDVDVDALIARGGEVASEKAATASVTVKTVPLRVSEDLLAQIDASVKAQPIKTPRNTWLLHAIMEKLAREQG